MPESALVTVLVKPLYGTLIVQVVFNSPQEAEFVTVYVPLFLAAACWIAFASTSTA